MSDTIKIKYLINSDDGVTYAAHDFSDADRQAVKYGIIQIIRVVDLKIMTVNKYDMVEWVELPKL